MLGGSLRRMAVVAGRSVAVRGFSGPSALRMVAVSGIRTPSTLQTRAIGSVEVFGPFDPPKQLTFKEVEARVMKAIRGWDRFPSEKTDALNMDSTFADLGFDSLDQVEIMMAVEDEFSFEIPVPEQDRLKTPRDIFKLVCDREDVFE